MTGGLLMKHRSILFVPPISDKMIDNGLTAEADRVIFDLEDAAAVQEKKTARSRLSRKLASKENLHTFFIRINDAKSPFYQEDVEAVQHIPDIGIVLPKTASAEQVKQLQKKLPGRPILPIIESAAGVWYAKEIAEACEEVETLAFGSIDFSLDIHSSGLPDESELLYARSKIVLACRLAGKKPPVDGVYTNFHDEEGFRRQAAMVKGLGFHGKLLIHPSQVKQANEVFSPSDAEVRKAEKIVRAFQDAEAEGHAAVQVDGEMIDYPVYYRARTVLQTSGKS
ncbi:MAG: CoA ester lyase [Alkalicoccus sp.]|nr:MAG: CoA ester lyase [Alkalicoccus sp.]